MNLPEAFNDKLVVYDILYSIVEAKHEHLLVVCVCTLCLIESLFVACYTFLRVIIHLRDFTPH
jgi:hypothetical protein